jgi:hypothetical protein
MNCHLVVQTECCKNNCQTEEKHDDMDEYEEEQTDEEDIDSLSTITKMG